MDCPQKPRGIKLEDVYEIKTSSRKVISEGPPPKKSPVPGSLLYAKILPTGGKQSWITRLLLSYRQTLAN
jgi:hypothetical protein